MRTTTRTRSTFRGLAVAAALLVAVTACAGGDDTDADAGSDAEVEAPEDDTSDDDAGDADTDADDADTDADDADTGDDAADADDAPGSDAVAMRNINFVPADLDVAVGTTVTFTNEDIVRHTVTAGTPDEPGDAFDEELDSEGDTVTVTFDEEGSFDYFCRLHPTMTGTITVG